MKINIPNITLVCIDCLNYGGAYNALKNSLAHITPKRTVLFTDIKVKFDGIQVIQIPTIKSKEAYSEFVIRELYKHFDTDFVWIVQHDGYILSMKPWTDEFFNYDGIGAKWLYSDGRNNFNGGFSIRSKKLQTILGTDPMIQITDPEDSIIGRLYRRYLEKTHGIKFPPDDLCDQFAFELAEPVCHTVGFHGNFFKPYRPSMIFTRSGACGDIVQMESILRYWYEKGVNIVLNIPFYFMELFSNHDFPIKHILEFDHQRIPSAHVDLDGSYESKPSQLHLKSYYEACGITDGPIVNPKLNVGFNPQASQFKLFNKYVVLHLDIRDEPHRQIRGVNWESVVYVLNKLGYTVIQVGIGKNFNVRGAIEMKTPNIAFLKWVIGSSDLMIGIDSGISNIASALGVPAVIFSGSVDLRLIHPDMSNILWINKHDEKPCPTPMCWHDVVSVNGKDCIISKENPPCVEFNTSKTIDKIKTFINEQAQRPKRLN